MDDCGVDTAERAPGSVEAAVRAAVADVFDAPTVADDADFFVDLHADSLAVAELCARLRADGLPPISIKDVYQHRSVRTLAVRVDAPGGARETVGTAGTWGAGGGETEGSVPGRSGPAPPAPPDRPVGTPGYWLCGTLQLLVLFATTAVTAVALTAAFETVETASGVVDTYLRAVWVGALVFAGLTIVPIAVKSVVVGRWTPRTIRLWSLGHVRFWIAQTAVRANPLVLLAGSPIYVLYLRALGARIGPGTVILSRRVPVCTDLLTIGAGTVVREEASFLCYRARGRHLELGPVEIGAGAFVGEGSVLDIGTRIGDRAQLGHSSSLASGQVIPAGERLVGTPASTAVTTDFADVPPSNRSRARRTAFGAVQLALVVLIATPIPMALGSWFVEWRSASPPDGAVLGIHAIHVAPDRVLFTAATIFVGLIVVRLIGAFVVARLIAKAVPVGSPFPVYGVRYVAHRTVKRLTNIRFFTEMLGDSSYIVHYLHALGYRIDRTDNTGANFGQTVVHDNPYAVSVGHGTMAADNITLPNARYSSSSCRIDPVEVGARSFFGNQIIFPAGAAVGDNCLLASKVAVPVDGPPRTDVGLLGSPAFEIPRLVYRDRGFEERRAGPDFPNTLAKKNAHNRRSMGWFLLYRFVGLLGAVAIAFGAADVFDGAGPLGVFGGLVLATVMVPAYRATVEWASIGFRRMPPMQLSIYDRRSWRIERFWKLSREPRLLNGTPFKGAIWRLYGVRVGRRLFDDGALLTDKTMTTLGDDCVLNDGAVVQAHSQEDGSFKSDRVVIGSGCTLGTGSLVHYGVTLGDGSTIEPNAFVMKGSDVPPGAVWGENPARELTAAPVAPTRSSPPDPEPHTEPPLHTPRVADDISTAPDEKDGIMVRRITSHTSGNGAAALALRRNGDGPDDGRSERDAPGRRTGRVVDATAVQGYWREALSAGAMTPIPRWTTGDHDTEAEITVPLPDGRAAELRRLADDLDAGVDAVLLAVHARVVAALTGEDDAVVGYAFGSAPSALPCRFGVAGVSWRELVTAAADTIDEVVAHREIDLDALRAELHLAGPPFETVVESAEGPVPHDPRASLALSLRHGLGGSRLALRHLTLDFDEETATRIAVYHLRALDHACAAPDEPVRARSVVTAEEAEYQIDGLAGRRRELPDRRFHELFEDRVTRHPDATAARHLDECWTYADLDRHANLVARALVDAGIGREDVVAVVTERNLAWMASVVGIFKAGGVYLPIEPHFPAGRIEKTLARAGCRLALTEEGSTTTLDEALGALPDIERRLLGEIFDGDVDASSPGVEVAAGQLAYIYFTSGSTGEPKGAMCEHAGMLNHLFAKIDDFSIGEGEVVAQIAPQCFDISLWQLVSALLVGSSTLIVDQETILRPPDFVDTIADGGVGVMQVVPSYLEVLLTHLDQHPRALEALHCVSVTGEALTLDLAQRFFRSLSGVALANAYGLTETSDDTNHEVMTEPPVGSVPLGTAIANAFVYVLDQHLAPAPLGAPGEIAFSGVCVGRGYINDPERTAAAYLDDPLRPGERLYRSGDFGRWRPDGKLEYLGRRDAQVKIRGFRIEIGEIENVLAGMDGVRQAAVVVTDRDDGNKQLVGFYAGTHHPLEQIRAHLGRSLPDYMVPGVIHWRETLPLTDNGKIDRKTLRTLAEDLELGTDSESDATAPTTPSERRLAMLWSDILGVPVARIGRHDHFFDRGGSSLSAVELVVALDNEISLQDVAAMPVLADLARVLAGETESTGDLLQQLSDPNDAPALALVCVPWAGGNALSYRSLAAELAGSPIGVHAIELPGHQLGGRDDDFVPLDEVADRAADEIRRLGAPRIALWGHSAGAALALEIADRLDRAGVDVEAVFVAAQLLGSPAERRAALDALCSTSDRRLVEQLARRSGDAGDAGDADDAAGGRLAHLGAALRHDVAGACRALVRRLDGDDRIDVPIVVVTAADDASTAEAASRYRDWERIATTVEWREVASGGHFFVGTAAVSTADVIAEVVLGDDDPATVATGRPQERARPRRSEPTRRVVTRPTEFEVATATGAPPLVTVDGDPYPVAWAAHLREQVRDELTRRGSLLVRGLSIADHDELLTFAHILSNGLADDVESFAPRSVHVDGVYSSSAWPANQPMCLHHELSYRRLVPRLVMFHCRRACDAGGAIQLADASRVIDALPGDLVERAAEHGWILDRNYTDEIGLSVADAFGTDDRSSVEAYCRMNSIEFEWRSDGGLRTRQRRPAVIEHPATGRRCWFNQLAFLNEFTMKPEVRGFLVDMYGEDGLPFTTRFGDGGPIDADTVAAVNAAYDVHTVSVPLQDGDLVMVDNIATAHGREAYDGARDVAVVMGDPWAPPTVEAVEPVATSARRRSRRRPAATA